MPIYEYECQKCGHRFEYLVLSQSPEPECPACQKKDLKQLISLCSVSSEGSREANLAGAHKKSGGEYKDRKHEEHKQLHHHFES